MYIGVAQIYLGVKDTICNGASMLSVGGAGLSAGVTGMGFRLKAWSMFSTCRS